MLGRADLLSPLHQRRMRSLRRMRHGLRQVNTDGRRQHAEQQNDEQVTGEMGKQASHGRATIPHRDVDAKPAARQTPAAH